MKKEKTVTALRLSLTDMDLWDLCKLLDCNRPDTVHNLHFNCFLVQRGKDVIAIPITCGTGSEYTNISVTIVKDEKDGIFTGGETKLGLVSDDIIPSKACLIPDLIKTLSYKPVIAKRF